MQEGRSFFLVPARSSYIASVTEVLSAAETAGRLLAASSGLRRSLRRRTDRSSGVSDLTDAQRELLRTVRRHPGIRVGEAAAELHLAANTVSTLVTSLVTTGWIRRETDPQDARSAQLFLTGEADRRIEERRDRWLAALIEAMASLAPEEQERIAAAIPALDRLVTRLTDGE